MAQGATVINSRFSTSLSAGTGDEFVMTMKADNPNETGMILTVTTAGNCSQWLKTDKQSVSLNKDGTPITASIKVPADAVNGNYKCMVQYTSPKSGMITSRIEVPVYLAITGGKTAPAITTAPAISKAPTLKPTATATRPTQAPTERPIERPTIKAPVQEQEKDSLPSIPMNTIIGLCAAILIGVFGIVMIHDSRRGK